MPQSMSFVRSETAALAAQLMSAIGGGDTILLGDPSTGETTAVSPEIARLVREILATLASGKPVMVAEPIEEMTPNQAADFLNVSRPYVLKLLDEAVLPYRLVGTHKRIPYADLAAYKVQQMARSRRAMAEIIRHSEDNGLYEQDGPPPDKSVFRGEGPGVHSKAGGT